MLCASTRGLPVSGPGSSEDAVRDVVTANHAQPSSMDDLNKVPSLIRLMTINVTVVTRATKSGWGERLEQVTKCSPVRAFLS